MQGLADANATENHVWSFIQSYNMAYKKYD